MIPETPSVAAGAAAQRTAWLLFAPPAVLVGLRQVLDWQAERGPATLLLPLAPFVGTQNPWAWLPTLGWALAGLAAMWLLARAARRRWGLAPVLRVAAGLWVLLCAAGAAAMVWSFMNLQGAQPLAPVMAQVLGSRAKAPSMRGPGGTLLVLRIDGIPTTQQVLIDDPEVGVWGPGQVVQLQWAQGRSSGRFVTGWQALPVIVLPALPDPAL